MRRHAVSALIAIAVVFAGAPLGNDGAGKALAQVTTASPVTPPREQLIIVGSRVMQPYIEAAIQRFVAWSGLPVPRLDLEGSTTGIRNLCEGVGHKHADIAVSTRRIHRNEVDICDENGVGDLIEIALGFDAVVAAIRPSDTPMALKLEHIYRAAAAVMPEHDDFKRNDHKTWNEIDPALPKVEIRLLIPGKAAGARSVFNDIFMEGGCRYVPEIRQIFSAEERVERCITLRDDGVVTEFEDANYIEEMLARFRDAPAGTVAIMDYDLAYNAGIPLVLLPVEGIAPTPATIGRDDYPATTKLHVYFKKSHMLDANGRGIARGIRGMMEELVSDRAIGPNGYILELGLIGLSNAELGRQRRAALKLRRLSPKD